MSKLKTSPREILDTLNEASRQPEPVNRNSRRVSARLPKIHERRHNVIAVTARVNVDERSIDNRVPAAFDVRKRRVEHMPAMIPAIVVIMVPVMIAVIVNFDDARRSVCRGRSATRRQSLDC